MDITKFLKNDDRKRFEFAMEFYLALILRENKVNTPGNPSLASLYAEDTSIDFDIVLKDSNLIAQFFRSLPKFITEAGIPDVGYDESSLLQTLHNIFNEFFLGYKRRIYKAHKLNISHYKDQVKRIEELEKALFNARATAHDPDSDSFNIFDQIDILKLQIPFEGRLKHLIFLYMEDYGPIIPYERLERMISHEKYYTEGLIFVLETELSKDEYEALRILNRIK